MIKRICFILFIGVLSLNVFAQPENAEVETVDGKKYYVHFVQAGNTLYGIHKLYNSPIESILNANEGLTNDLTVGQKIYIPISTDNTQFYGEHIVQEGETLYGISRKYDCTVTELQNLNPTAEKGLKPGQKLILPTNQNNGSEGVTTDPIVQDPPSKEYNVAVSDSVVNHTVLDHETLYSISKRYMVSQDTIRTLNGIRGNKIKPGQIIKIPIKKVNYTVLEKDITQLVVDDSTLAFQPVLNKKEVYKVALILPFMFDKNDQEMSKTLKVGEEREMNPLTQVCFEFYQGFKLAADSLKKAGLKVQIVVFDTKNDTNEVLRIFQKPEMQNVDLVIGPLYDNCIKTAIKKSAEKGINLVLPFKSQTETIHNNPNVFATVASNMTLYDGVVDYVVERHNTHKVLLLKPQYGDMTIYNRVRDQYNEKIKAFPNAYSKQILDIPMGSSGGRDINIHVALDTVNVFIVPSVDVKIVSGCLNRLNKVMNINSRAKKLKILVFGVEDWNKIDDLDILHKIRLNHHYATYRHVDFNTGKGLEFVRSFRSINGIDPTKYSTQGFDVGLFFMSSLYMYGTQFQSYIHNNKTPLVQNNFNFVQIAEGSGFENQGTQIIRFSGYHLQKMN